MMNKTLTYKNYLGSIEFDLEDNYLHGSILFINDKIIYSGETLEELKQSFETAVDDYLEFCQEMGKEPEKPCSGRFNVRISPKLHADCLKQAKQHHLSLNAFIAKTLEESLA